MGGVVEIIVIVFGVLLYPISEQSFILKATGELFKARTVGGLCPHVQNIVAPHRRRVWQNNTLLDGTSQIALKDNQRVRGADHRPRGRNSRVLHRIFKRFVLRISLATHQTEKPGRGPVAVSLRAAHRKCQRRQRRQKASTTGSMPPRKGGIRCFRGFRPDNANHDACSAS